MASGGQVKANLEWFDTYLGQSVKIEGRFVVHKSIRIDGLVNGNVEASGKTDKTTIAVGDTGEVRGDIKSHRVIISGKVIGNIYADEQVMLGPTAKVNGDISYSKIIVEQGAVVTGSLIMKDGNKTIVDTALDFFKKNNLSGSKD